MKRDAGGQKIGKKQIPDHMEIQGASVHILKHIDLDIPLHEIVGITGVPGSGKSLLAPGVLYARVHSDICSHPSFEGEKKGLRMSSVSIFTVAFRSSIHNITFPQQSRKEQVHLHPFHMIQAEHHSTDLHRT